MPSVPIYVLAGQSNANNPIIAESLEQEVQGAGGIFIHTAYGGSGLAPYAGGGKGSWHPSLEGKHFDTMTAEINSYLDPSSPNYVEGAYLENIVWIQGETDSRASVPAMSYGDHLEDLRTALHDEFGPHNMTVVSLSDHAPVTEFRGENWQIIQDSQIAFDILHPDVSFLDIDAVAAQAGISPDQMFMDDVHYDRRSGFSQALSEAISTEILIDVSAPEVVVEEPEVPVLIPDPETSDPDDETVSPDPEVPEVPTPEPTPPPVTPVGPTAPGEPVIPEAPVPETEIPSTPATGEPREDSDEDDRGEQSPDETCFIATAAYGGGGHADVRTLRDFRDMVLVRHPIGRLMIRLYWKAGPILARHVDHRTGSGRFVRRLVRSLTQIIGKN